MPLFWGDYLRDTTGLTAEEHGALLLLLMDLQHRGERPLDHRTLARVVRASPRRWARIWPAIAPHLSTDGLTIRAKVSL